MRKGNLIEALVIMGIGALGLAGSISMQQELNSTNLSVALGPAKYSGVISLVMTGLGAFLLFRLIRERKGHRGAAGPPVVSKNGLILILVLLLYMTAIPLVGFNGGSFCFFPVLFYVSGMRPWRKSLIFGLVMAALFYLVFIYGAKIPVPKGGLGI